MLLLQLLETQVCGSFIIAHVVIPGTRKLEELRSLRTFNSDQFLLLSLTHVLQLTKHLLILEVIKLELGSSRFW